MSHKERMGCTCDSYTHQNSQNRRKTGRIRALKGAPPRSAPR